MPTTIQVIGTVTLDTINYQDFVQTFKSANQQNQWKVKRQWTSEISENNIFGEIDIFEESEDFAFLQNESNFGQRNLQFFTCCDFCSFYISCYFVSHMFIF